SKLFNAEDDDEDDRGQQVALRSSSHTLEIELYIGYRSDRSTNSPESNEEEYNPLSFWQKMHQSYRVLSKVAAHVLCIPASSAAVEREFSLAGNIIPKKHSKLSSDLVNDMVFNHSSKMYQQTLHQSDKVKLN
ncbi:unnamed protein product, partial [Rotaria sordida]